MKNRKLINVALASAAIFSVATPAVANAAPSPADVQGVLSAPARTQVSVDHTYTGLHAGTPNENESRYSLSLTKLLLADYIYEHGTQADKDKATAMIQRSDDNLATELSGRYPQAIQSKANQYGMKSAVPASTWGNWKFSSADWSRYLSAKHREDPTGTGPLLSAMRSSQDRGADGYYQRYGVALLPGVQGWKSGWSDDRTSYHASVGFGNDWSVAVQTNGGADALNNDLTQALNSGLAANPIPKPPAPLPTVPAPVPGSSAPAIPGIPMQNYPARAVAQASVDNSKQWVNQNVAPVDKVAANNINASIDSTTAPIINAVPENVQVPTALVGMLPPAPR